MKAKTFENLIRKVVREEIDYALRREIKTLKEDLRDDFKPTITEHTERLVEVPDKPQMSEKAKNSLKEKIMGTSLNKPPKNFTSNNTLNDLLNETAQGDTNTTSAMAPVDLSQPFATSAPMEDTTGMPDPIAKAVTRDYSDLMKAMNKKRPIDR
tara:strand:+ start:3815 stop:4276 length:462 start_codon:yes stop_codon:yes gene_type:complete